jgi:hypothetical protein
MLVYVNGDEISGGACAINDFVLASDDIHHAASGNKSHPDNIMHSYGYYFSRLFNLAYRCEATVKKDNHEIYNGVLNFVDNILPKLNSQYTVIVVGWMPDPDVGDLNLLADRLEQLNLNYVFFNTKKPLLKSAKLEFNNPIDLTDKDECFLQWCKLNKHELKNNRYPSANAHNAWAKYLFNKFNHT